MESDRRSADDRHGSGRQDEPLLCAERSGRSGRGRQRRHHEEGNGAGIRRAAAQPDGDGSGDAFAVGEPVVAELWAGNDRGQRAASKTDQPEQPQGRPAGRANAGAAGARGPAVAATDPAPQRGSTKRSDGDAGAGIAGGGAYCLGEQRARLGQSAGRALAEMRHRPTLGWNEWKRCRQTCNRRCGRCWNR